MADGAVLAGSFALGGVAVQQLLTMPTDDRRGRREAKTVARQERHQAFLDLVRIARQVQRRAVDWRATPSPEVLTAFGVSLDTLAEAIAVMRLVTSDAEALTAAELFEQQAKDKEHAMQRGEDHLARISLGPLVDALRAAEER